MLLFIFQAFHLQPIKGTWNLDYEYRTFCSCLFFFKLLFYVNKKKLKFVRIFSYALIKVLQSRLIIELTMEITKFSILLTVNDDGLLHRGILKLYELNYDYLRVIRKATFCRLHSLGSVWKKLPSKQRRTNREGLISQKSSQKPVISIFSHSFFQMNMQETLFWRREKAFFTRWFWFWLKLFPRSEAENAS